MPESTRTLAGLDLIGGSHALDLSNTINSRIAPEHDYLATYGDLVAWAERATAISGATARILSARGRNDRPAAERALRHAHGLRDAVYRTFSAIAAGERVALSDLRRVLRAYGAAVSRGSLRQRRAGMELEWPAASRATVLDPIAYAAGALLLSTDRPPIKECPGCGWLFLDHSRNGSRRWCDMRTCGSRDKMRRYYRTRRSGKARV